MVVLVSLACSSFVSAGVDLQPRNVFIVTAADQLISNLDPGFYVNIQNNGPDDFQGTFSISYSYDGMDAETSPLVYSGTIESGFFKAVKVSSHENITWVKIDSKNEISETNENNNDYYCYDAASSQIRVTSSWTGVIAENYYPTLCVLPNEFFFQQFSLQELNNQSQKPKGSIIGFKFSNYASGFSGSEQYCFEVQSFWPEGVYQDGILEGGKYSFDYNPSLDKYHSSCEWMANSSSSALDYFWLGSFYGILKGMAIGSEAKIGISTQIALIDKTNKTDFFTKTIKAIDRIRGDVNDDGIVDQADLDILVNVVDKGLYNPCMSYKNMYQERGLNYGAGIVMFDVPDFLSNCLINIWLNDKNDPLVPGLGIGELMSTTAPGMPTSAVYGVKNTFTVSGDNLIINAPEADLYNVVAQTPNAKVYQVTGKVGEQIILPKGSSHIRVETVKVKHSLTALISPKNNLNVSVYPTKISDYVDVKYAGNGKVQVVNLAGQTIFSSPVVSNEELRIDAKSWSNGVYVINVISETGTKSTKVIK